MELQEILSSSAVKTTDKATSKKKLLQDLGQHCADLYGLNADEVFQALQDRELLGPTAMGHGVAIPHARLPGLDAVRGFFMRLTKPIDFDAVDRQPVDLVFVLLAPENAGAAHLKALARVSRALRDPAVCAKLRAHDADESVMYYALLGSETSKAA
ncbi:PTS sugar transporter subunit IIA [Abyssibius alkaniclasticus]|uniref:PTS sugar transporter subunit IIA n=1 Tax=Abyssibius alkaniclasticus TaxID=2881234 RepID=UPI0023634D4D|nr:PTS sugar transporter subunit IIA [Abyssibius alkaniclasticus]UPH71924.1 PTS sugar transporter subunit IIA [Abyssibius alkaniclasticus]